MYLMFILQEDTLQCIKQARGFQTVGRPPSVGAVVLLGGGELIV
jgi:hypothetical protein